jgi:hypothetical protein
MSLRKNLSVLKEDLRSSKKYLETEVSENILIRKFSMSCKVWKQLLKRIRNETHNNKYNLSSKWTLSGGLKRLWIILGR